MFANLMKLGDSAMLHGNVAQARTLYERAAAIHPASSAALLAAGKTYDPNILSSLGLGSRGFADPAKAREWYERARVLGDPAVAPLLARLP
jgi:TPR repeat protein